MARTPKTEPGEGGVFAHDTCLYRGKDGEDARIFRTGETVPSKAEGWRNHPDRLKATKDPAP